MKPIKEESMSLTERTQSVSSVPKIPMDFIEFKSRYNELLNHHLNENIYHDELSFIKKWFDTYSNGSDVLQNRTKPELLTPIEKRGLDVLKTKNYYYDLELTFTLICKFLKQRRKEVKTELKTKPEPPQQNEIIDLDAVKKNKPDFKIPYSIMNDAILSLELSLMEEKKTVPVYVKQEQTYVPKPCFKPESIDGIMTILNNFFETSQQDELKRIIETGSNSNKKLLFRDNGNKLTDYFKKLFESNIITGCYKKDLINWIVQNFENIRGEYKFRTVEKIISGEGQPCKNPII